MSSVMLLSVNLRLECGPVYNRLPLVFGCFDHAAIGALAAFFRAYLNKADGFSLRRQSRFGMFEIPPEYVRQTDRISFSFAERIVSMSLMNSSVSF